MKLKVIWTLALLCAFAQGVWAQTTVKSEQELKDAIADGATNIQLTADILLENYLNIEGVTVTIDLNGHRLYRNLSNYDRAGHVIWAHNGSDLTLTSSVAGGSIEGGMAYNGGAIHIPNGNTVSATNVIFQNNSAFEHAGAIWNNGTFTATNCTFTDNTANDVGGIYNSVTETNGTTYAGTATLTCCTFERNAGTAGAGALANALGNTVMTIEDCTIENNSAYQYGAGIWNGGTLNMKGKITVTDNTNVGGMDSNVYLKSETVITLTGALTNGSNIGMDLESVSGTFTSGYSTFHNGVTPYFFFGSDHLSIVSVGLDDKKEVCLVANVFINYIERSWDATNKQVISREKTLTGIMIGYDATPYEGQYKEVTNAPASDPNEWFGMGGHGNNVAEFYVVRGNVNRETIVVQGKNVHLILCDGATLTLTGGLKLEGDNKLYIHSQSYGGDMGRLMVTNKYDRAAGIGSAQHNGVAVEVGELVIYGGHIEATGGEAGAGIGSCKSGESDICKSVTVYGGFVKATGGKWAAGIGGGSASTKSNIAGGLFVLYDGMVIAQGGEYAAGVGGGIKGAVGDVLVYGGSLTATGGDEGAGIGNGSSQNNNSGNGSPFHPSLGSVKASIGDGTHSDSTKYADKHRAKKETNKFGRTFTIFGGTVTATGGKGAAGIGGGLRNGDVEVNISGGSVTANGGEDGAGIGGGYYRGGTVTINGGTVTANGGYKGAGIGGGHDYSGGTVTINGGTVTANGGEESAGIGGGAFGRGGTVTINGGTVAANGGYRGAGIGGGNCYDGGDVTINGGSVIAKAGIQGDTGHRAIGPGLNNDNYGTLSIGDAMMVGAGDNGTVESIFDADERKNGCWFRSYAEISPCTHPSGVTYTINEDGTHTTHCKHCSLAEKVDHVINDGTGTCICGYKDGGVYCTITIATSRSGTGYEGVGVMAKVGNNMPYTLPVCSSIPEGYDFAGWAVNPTNHNGILPNEGEELKQAGEDITVTTDVSIFARYKPLTISLADDGDNAETLYNYDGRKATSVTLTGRTLWKDGGWNTLCLPFDLTIAGSPLDGDGVDVRTLASSSFDESDGTLTLTFTPAEGEGAVTAIEAGMPYIIKWTGGSHIVGPTFSGVTISNSYNPVETDYVDFVGTYSPIDIFTEYRTNLYLGANDLLYYPSGEEMTSFPINSFRAFFQLKNGLLAGEPVSTDVQPIKAFVLNFGEETGISEISNPSNPSNSSNLYFTLDGRRLDKPSSPGLYIHNGQKVLIK